MIEFFLNIITTYKQILLIVSVLSIIALVLSPIVFHQIIIRLPQDYFIQTKDDRKPLSLLRNLAGMILVAVGLAMFVLPGQGLITFVIGLSLINFPGKRELQLRIIKNSKFQKSINWFRMKSSKQPFIFPK